MSKKISIRWNSPSRIPSHQSSANRVDLGAEHPWGDRGQLIFIIVFLVVWVLDSFILAWSTFLGVFISQWVRVPIAGIIIIVAVWLIQKSQTVVFGEVRDPPRVIDTGVFGWVRHPMYLGALLALLGFVVSTCSLLSLAVWVAMCVFYGRITAFEEEVLVKIFGQSYVNYQHRVPKWVPRIGRPVPISS